MVYISKAYTEKETFECTHAYSRYIYNGVRITRIYNLLHNINNGGELNTKYNFHIKND